MASSTLDSSNGFVLSLVVESPVRGRLGSSCQTVCTACVGSIAKPAHAHFKSFYPLSTLNVIHMISHEKLSLSLAYKGSKVVHHIRLGARREPGNETSRAVAGIIV